MRSAITSSRTMASNELSSAYSEWLRLERMSGLKAGMPPSWVMRVAAMSAWAISSL